MVNTPVMDPKYSRGEHLKLNFLDYLLRDGGCIPDNYII